MRRKKEIEKLVVYNAKKKELLFTNSDSNLTHLMSTRVDGSPASPSLRCLGSGGYPACLRQN